MNINSLVPEQDYVNSLTNFHFIFPHTYHASWYYEGFFYLPTDAQVNCLKNNFKIYIKIDIKTAPTCFGVITIIRERIIRACWSYSC